MTPQAELLLPTDGCTCEICQHRRADEAAAEALNAVLPLPAQPDAAQGKLDAKAGTPATSPTPENL